MAINGNHPHKRGIDGLHSPHLMREAISGNQWQSVAIIPISAAPIGSTALTW